MTKLHLVSSGQKLNQDIKQIYIDSFPSDERREWLELEQILQQPKFNLTQVFDDQELIGFISTWNLPDFIFIEHFAIKKSVRGKGLGSQVIKLILNEKSPRIILEVEEPTTGSKMKRITFYERLGFSVCESNYWQPPYCADKSKVKMLLMSFPDKIHPREFTEIKTHIYREVYQLKEFMDLE